MRERRSSRSICILVLGMTALAALGLRTGYLHRNVLPLQSYEGTEHSITATILETRSGFSPGYMMAVAEVEAVDGTMCRPFRVSIRQMPRREVGARVSGDVTFVPLRKDRYLYASYADGVYLGAQLQEGSEVVTQEPRPALRWHFARWRTGLSEQIRRVLPNELGDLAAAMTVGDRGDLPDDLEGNFRTAGISHLLVVSGLHLSVVSAGGYWLFSKRLGRRKASAAACGLTVLFMALVGFTPSVVRAGVMMLAVYGAKILGEKEDTLTSMGLALLLLCLWNPFAVVDIGLLLSFSATLGVLAAAELGKKIRYRWQESPKRIQRLLGRVLPPALVPLAASAATLPVMIAIGGGVSVYGLLGNLLTVPLVGPALVAGFAAELTAFVPLLDGACRFFGLLCGLLMKWFCTVAAWLASFPGSMIYITGFYALCVCLIGYGLLGCAWHWRLPWRKAAVPLSCFILAAIVLYAVGEASVIRLEPAGNAENAPVVAIQGDTTVVFYRGGKTNLEDVRETLAQYNRSGVDLLVDLRQDPDEFSAQEALNAKQVFTAESDCMHQAYLEGVLPDASIRVVRQGEGCYAVLDAGGVFAGISSGKVDLAREAFFAVYFGGSGTVSNLRCETLALTRTRREWTWSAEAEKIAEGTLAGALIRSGASIRCREVQYGIQ